MCLNRYTRRSSNATTWQLRVRFTPAHLFCKIRRTFTELSKDSDALELARPVVGDDAVGRHKRLSSSKRSGALVPPLSGGATPRLPGRSRSFRILTCQLISGGPGG